MKFVIVMLIRQVNSRKQKKTVVDTVGVLGLIKGVKKTKISIKDIRPKELRHWDAGMAQW